MIERKTVIEQPELHRSGLLNVKIALLLVDGDTEIQSSWHRVTLELGDDAREQMAHVNQYLAENDPPLPSISESDIQFIEECHALQKSRFARED